MFPRWLPLNQYLNISRKTSSCAILRAWFLEPKILDFNENADSRTFILVYHRLFGTSRLFKISLWVLAAFIFCYSLVEVLLSVFQCLPINKLVSILPESCLLPCAVLQVFSIQHLTKEILISIPCRYVKCIETFSTNLTLSIGICLRISRSSEVLHGQEVSLLGSADSENVFSGIGKFLVIV